MKRVVVSALVVAFASLANTSRAEDKANPTGTWKWTIEFGGQSRESTMKLKTEGDKLTGVVIGRDNKERPIEDAKLKDGDISFKMTRETPDGQKFVIKFSGKLQGDSIKGKIEFEREGQTQSMDWDAKREKS